MKIHHFIYVFVIGILFIVNGCKEDNPVNPPEDHIDAEGLRLYQSGVKVLEYWQGTLTAGLDTLYAPLNNLSENFNVKFLDNKKSEFKPDDDHYKFGAVVSDTTVVTFYQHPGEEGSFEFHLYGKKEKITTIKLQLLHGGHADFSTKFIPVVVR